MNHCFQSLDMLESNKIPRLFGSCSSYCKYYRYPCCPSPPHPQIKLVNLSPSGVHNQFNTRSCIALASGCHGQISFSPSHIVDRCKHMPLIAKKLNLVTLWTRKPKLQFAYFRIDCFVMVSAICPTHDMLNSNVRGALILASAAGPSQCKCLMFAYRKL